MKWSNLNPVTWFNKEPDKAEVKSEPKDANTNTGLAPIENSEQQQGMDAVPVESGIWISADVLDAGQAQRRTRDFEATVNSFDEDKETLGHWITHRVLTILAYVLPASFALFGGWAIGDVFVLPTTPLFTSLFYHLMSVGVETLTPMAGIMAARKIQQAKRDRGLIVLCIFLLLVFIAVATANAIAQEVFLYSFLVQKTTVEIASVWFRSFGPSIFDAVALIYLATSKTKSLKKFLHDQSEKSHAVQQVAASAIELDRAHLQAGIERQSALQDMQSKARRASTWNEIEAMQAEQMIEQARKNMLNNGDNGGSFRRSRY